MIKNRKIINIFTTAALPMILSLLLVFNGCTNTGSNNMDTAIQEDISSDAGGVSQESNNETIATENESKDADELEQENKGDSSQSSDTSEEQDNSLKGIHERFIKSGKPSILIFSYDADCCPGTEAFFEEYNAKAMNLTKNYSDVFNTVFINIGILDKDNMNTVTELAVKYEVLNLPSILLLDSSGKSYKVIDGVFDENEVKTILDGMIND